jgi:peptide/nickel transport system permease protein
MIVPTLMENWNLNVTGAVPLALLTFLSNMNIFNSFITGNWPVFKDSVQHMILPAIALGTIPLALIARMTRSSLLEVLNQDYIRTARAKGLRDRAVVMRHGFRNALIPVVTIVGLSFGSLLAGAVLTETIFGLSGVGRILFDAIQARDYAIVQGFTLIIAAFFVIINLVVDVTYAFLDPRVRLS